MLKNLSLGTKLIGAFFLMAAIVAFTGSFGIRTIDRVGTEVNAIMKTSAATETALKDTSASVKTTLAETEKTLADLRGDMKQVLANADKTLESARSALKQSEQTLQAYSDDSRLVTEMNKTMRELSATSRSFRNLSDYLERHPESLIRGKAGAKGD